MRLLIEVLIACAFVALLQIVNTFVLKGKFQNQKVTSFAVVIAITLSVASYILDIGTTTINGIFEKYQYEEYYYVKLYDYDTEEELKICKGLISKDVYTEEYSDGSYCDFDIYIISSLELNGIEYATDSYEHVTLDDIRAGYKFTIACENGKKYSASITQSKVK